MCARTPCLPRSVSDMYKHMQQCFWRGCLAHYEVATISRLLKIIGLFCRISSLLQGSFAKETYNFKASTNRSHRIHICTHTCTYLRMQSVVRVEYAGGSAAAELCALI